MPIILGLGEMGTINKDEEELKTFALGSCIGLVLLDHINNIAGMAHIVLPDSNISPDRAQRDPGRFADTAIPALIAEMHAKGANGKLVAKLFGGALIYKANDTYQVGKRNALTVKKLLWKNRIPALAEEIGGDIGRTISVGLNGEVRVSTPGMEDRVL